MAAPRKCLERARSCRLGTHSGLRCSWSLQLDSAVPSQRPRGGMKEGLWCWEVGSSPKRDLKEGGGSCPEGEPKSAQWVWDMGLEGLPLPTPQGPLGLPGLSGAHWLGWRDLGRGRLGKRKAREVSELLQKGQGRPPLQQGKALDSEGSSCRSRDLDYHPELELLRTA